MQAFLRTAVVSALVASCPLAAHAQDAAPTTAETHPPAAITPTLHRDTGLSVSGPFNPHHVGGWLFDDSVRDAVHAQSQRGRDLADTTSDFFLWSTVATPFVTAAVLPLTMGGNFQTVTNLELVNVEALGVSMLGISAFKLLFGRERPYAHAAGLAARCNTPEHQDDPECDPGRNTSFLSGHSALAFTGAGLLCAQTMLFGSATSTATLLPCGAAMAAATTTAALRIVADRHWTTDTLAGMALGLGAGLALPLALHFSEGAPLPVAGAMPANNQPQSVMPVLGAAAIGIAAGAIVPLASAIFHGAHDDRMARHRHHDLNVTPMATAQGGGGVAVGGTF